jgi:hypothetical protein
MARMKWTKGFAWQASRASRWRAFKVFAEASFFVFPFADESRAEHKPIPRCGERIKVLWPRRLESHAAGPRSGTLTTEKERESHRDIG